jgi:hypothetical protein
LTTFNVTVYANATSIGTREVFDLAPGANVTLIFSWNTSGLIICQSFTIRAEATPLPGETNLDNNVFTDGTVKIKHLGDVNSDGMVDMRDVTTLIRAFGTQPGDARWNPEADLSNDNIIDMKDATTTLRNYGKTC